MVKVLSVLCSDTRLSLSPSIVGKLGRTVKGVCSCWDWQLISGLIWLTILLSVATSTAGDQLDEFDDVLDVSYSYQMIAPTDLIVN